MIGNNLLMAGDEGYNLTRSLRFRASASAYLSRTPASAGNRQKFTQRYLCKRGSLSTLQRLATATNDALNVNWDQVFFNTSDQLEIWGYSGTSQYRLITSKVYRDPAGFYDLQVAFDTTQATASNRIRVYDNGVEITSFANATYPPLNYSTYFNLNSPHTIGYSASTFDGYLCDVYWVDGQQLTPSSFGSYNSTTGVWQPAKYQGTYGTNGFYLPFTDNSALTTSSNVGLGKDFSGNGNYWTTNNISITSGVTYDSMTDVPTLTSATAANFAVLNPLDNATPTLTNANLTPTSSGSWGSRRSTIGMTSGKWYCEVTSGGSTSNVMLGIISDSSFSGSTYIGAQAQGYGYLSNGDKYNNLSNVAYGATYTSGDVIGIVFDADARTLTFYKNNVSQGVAYSSIPAGTFYFAVSVNTTAYVNANFGQRPFTYTPPTGFVALNAYNLPDSTIKQGNKVMDAALYTGDGALSRTLTGLYNFQPDFIWPKNRSSPFSHVLQDVVRGFGSATKLASDSTAAENTGGQPTDPGVGYISSVNSTGFSVATTGGGITQLNQDTAAYVAWAWKANGAGVTNTNGTITSTVSVNASAGFSIVTYTGTGANATVGHGLGVAPSMYIVKRRNGAVDWGVYHSSLTSPAYGLYLNTTNAQFSAPTYWNSTAPTSSVFSLGTDSATNASAGTFVAYCWAEIAGFSKFGLWQNNNSTDGTFIYCGFSPAVIILKNSDNSENWYFRDIARQTYNVAPASNNWLMPNSSASEAANGANTAEIDALSNGFKIRTTNPAAGEISYGTRNYIYAAWAANPFKNSLAR